MTKSDEIQARRERYNRVERVVDDLGRTIGVKPLKPSEQVRIQEMAPGLEGTTTVVDDETGRQFEVPKTSPLIMAASVCEIDGLPTPFPKNRTELDAKLDRLDGEGLKAAAEALGRFNPSVAEPKDDAVPEAGAIDRAKNSPGTP